jgi:hypothetical protein
MSGVRERMAERARARAARRKIRWAEPDHLAREFKPLPMNERFWRDIEMLHLRCQEMEAYRVRQQRDMKPGLAR